MSTLYEITGEYLELLDMLQNAEEIEEEVLKDTLEAIDGELEVKADNYAKIIKELTLDAKKFEEEKKRLEVNQKTLENRAKKLKEYLYQSMKVTGKAKFKTDLFSFGIQKNGGQQPMTILPDMEIPSQYLKYEPDNTKIREALKKGEELPFARFEEYGTHLVIR